MISTFFPTPFVILWIHTFLLLHTQDQDYGTEDVDDADDPWCNQVSLFLRTEQTAFSYLI